MIKKSASEPNIDVTDNTNANVELSNVKNVLPSSHTSSDVKCADDNNSTGFVRLPKESASIPSDCKDLLIRLLDYKAQSRIRSIFSLQRIAFYMKYNFDDVKKKKVTTKQIEKSKSIMLSMC